YSATERECLAVVEAVKMFRPYLYSNEFTIITDHKALVWLDQHKDDKLKLMKWALELMEYNYTIKYRPGNKSGNVDALSRLPLEKKMPDHEEQTPEATPDVQTLQA